ncbi:MAG: SDR family NAD(P)-dependent oxidoreductase [Bacillota bacterium]|nr:SDR family NAD(P)-dependent oxidoreductase [Bacillota bacterium]
MKALITGASSGIGMEIAKQLDKMGYETILVARREERLRDLASKMSNKALIVPLDLSIPENCINLADMADDIEILVNNAGFGVFGEFDETDLKSELELIDTNIKALHILTKLFLKKFKEKNKGYILNIASSASFLPGPMFSSYYASKAYVSRLSCGVYEEIKKSGSDVKISTFCPGPVRTEFNQVAGVKFGIGSISAEYAARKAIKGMFKGKRIVTPNFTTSCMRFFTKIIPEFITAKVAYRLQKAKTE